MVGIISLLFGMAGMITAFVANETIGWVLLAASVSIALIGELMKRGKKQTAAVLVGRFSGWIGLSFAFVASVAVALTHLVG